MLRYKISVPANTSAADPLVSKLPASAGILRRIKIYFPPGPAELARATIWYQDFQIEPWNRDGYFAWDNYVEDFTCEHEIIAPNTDLIAKCWNLDDTYDHDISFGFVIEPPGRPSVESLITDLVNLLVGSEVK
jgi:hypothetical protein